VESPSSSAGHGSVDAACVWRGDWGSVHSLAIVNDAIAAALDAGAVRVERIPRQGRPSASEAVGIAHHWPPSFEAPSTGPFVLYQPWEFGRIPRRWVEEIRRRVDEVWTPSEASRQGFVESGVSPDLVQVVPNGVDLARFTPSGRAERLAAKETVFLFMGGPAYRKGLDLLLDAYGRAFTAADDVCLAVKSFGGKTFYRGQTSEETVRCFQSRADAPEVILLDAELSYDDVPALYRAADVLVQPYRGEGFCLPALEALACGRPVVVTAGGSTDDFVTDDCAWRIPARRVPLPSGAIPSELELAGEGFVLESDVPALVEVLREAADPTQRAERAAHARAHAERFGWARAGEIARARIDALQGRTPIRTVAPAAVAKRRRFLFAAVPDWERRESWALPLGAYAEAFGPEDDTTLLLPAADEAEAAALVTAELLAGGHDLASLADVALGAGSVGPVELELAADAVIAADGRGASRARVVCPPDPVALRALVAAP